MFTIHWDQITPEIFIKNYWQKRPILIKGGFAEFQDPISAEELAGLAMEEAVESRIVTNQDRWHVTHGPFESFESLGESHSTLLVQAVDHWHPEVSDMLVPFQLLPNWRVDDVMISYSTPQGGVGPHIDQYDVFIIQGQGSRRWRVGEVDTDLEQHCPHPSLQQVQPFEAKIDDVLEPGDILYIPPFCPHEGYAIEPSLNYSIGFRAPNQREMFSAFADHLIDLDMGDARFKDKFDEIQTNPGHFEPKHIEQIRNMMKQLLDDDALFHQWLGSFLSEAKHELDLEAAEPKYTLTEIIETIQSTPLRRLGGVRTFYITEPHCIQWFVNQTCVQLHPDNLAAVQTVTGRQRISASHVEALEADESFWNALTQLINQGYWYFEDLDE
ncbi:cupin domain-containing protein [Algicola sagamiensis]|uniref:cupin domain-containing protein n=1 Tax=Algicola sagamiensis TaxID=163869 RepID=UPI000375C5BA|nr:cupin domain-containing protein [Algicola sagamiensis]